MNTIKKKDNQEFIDKTCKALIEMGAKKVENKLSTFRSFVLDTIVGKLKINICTDNSYCYTAFSIFEDVKKAKEKFDCNPHSGKYNIHPSQKLSVKEAVELVKSHFEIL